jgi:hypothetical protein
MVEFIMWTVVRDVEEKQVCEKVVDRRENEWYSLIVSNRSVFLVEKWIETSDEVKNNGNNAKVVYEGLKLQEIVSQWRECSQ